MKMVQKSLVILFLALLLGVFGGCSEDEEPGDQLSSRAYKGHENDVDANNLVSVYPSIIGTRLDDCHTCHTGGMEEDKVVSNACDNCHQLMLHVEKVGSHTVNETLNQFGLDYLNAGRSKDALKSIKDKDSDGDGASNDEEILAQRYPGSNLSKPGQETAPLRIVSLDELKAMNSHEQFMLANTTKQQFDDYVTYKGVKVKALFAALNIDLTGATGVTVIAPDGFMKTIAIEQVDKVFPQPIFYSGLDVDTLGADCGFVNYPEKMPEGLSNGAPITGEHWLLLAYERDGMPMEVSYLDAVEGKIIGEGPLRIAVPQSEPGKPDRGLKYSPTDCNDGFDFDDNADHNAGAMVRGVIAIRVDPMPAGAEEFDYMNGGWAYIDGEQLIIYGYNVR